jgi:hypothetical protein
MMVYRKGELSSRSIDNGWPHQVALKACLTTGKNHDVVSAFCKDLSLAPRGHTLVRDDQYINVWCFSAKADAEKFQERFGGAYMTPEDRPRWPGKPRRR